MTRHKVLIADDHTMILEHLVSLLSERFEIVGTVRDGQQLIEAATKLRPDVIVTDLTMPGLGGMEVLRRLKAARQEVKVVVLTMHVDPDLATEALRAGAVGFVVKESAGEELVTAVESALQGRTYLTPLLTKDVLSRMSDGDARPKAELSPRQHEVLKLIVAGRRMKEIAAALNLSPRTVETHKYDMMASLGVQTTAELIRYAIENRLTGGR